MAGVVIPTSLPKFTYSNTNYTAELKSGWGWVIRFYSSGTLTFTEDQVIDVHILGGGGSGGGGGASCGGGGGGGYQTMKYGINVTAGTQYPIVVGSGASFWDIGGSRGGTSSAFDLSAQGGGGGKHGDSKNTWAAGGDGGTGHGATRDWSAGSNTVHEFNDASFPIYGGGGGHGNGGVGGSPYGGNGNSNARGYGGGGGGGNIATEEPYYDYGGAGGQGLVAVRNSSIDNYPIVFNGFGTIESFSFNGITPTHMTFNTKTLF